MGQSRTHRTQKLLVVALLAAGLSCSFKLAAARGDAWRAAEVSPNPAAVQEGELCADIIFRDDFEGGLPLNCSIVSSGQINLEGSTLAGLYINWSTGQHSTNPSPPFVPDANPYIQNGQLNFWWGIPVGDGSGCASIASSCTALEPGNVVGPGLNFSEGDGANFWHAGVTILGFVFFNENTARLSYGYAEFVSFSDTGSPFILVQYWYNYGGGPIVVQLAG